MKQGHGTISFGGKWGMRERELWENEKLGGELNSPVAEWRNKGLMAVRERELGRTRRRGG
eukprot:1185927-Prorocentrum_minimum.AAC.2